MIFGVGNSGGEGSNRGANRPSSLMGNGESAAAAQTVQSVCGGEGSRRSRVVDIAPGNGRYGSEHLSYFVDVSMRRFFMRGYTQRQICIGNGGKLRVSVLRACAYSRPS